MLISPAPPDSLRSDCQFRNALYIMPAPAVSAVLAVGNAVPLPGAFVAQSLVFAMPPLCAGLPVEESNT